MKTELEIKKKKRVLLEDDGTEWLQIWTAASSVNVKKSNKKNFVYLSNQSVFPNTVTYSDQNNSGHN